MTQSLEERIKFLQSENDRLHAQQIKTSKTIVNITESLVAIVKIMKEEPPKNLKND